MGTRLKKKKFDSGQITILMPLVKGFRLTLRVRWALRVKSLVKAQ